MRRAFGPEGKVSFSVKGCFGNVGFDGLHPPTLGAKSAPKMGHPGSLLLQESFRVLRFSSISIL
jgi:hypothetical protein